LTHGNVAFLAVLILVVLAAGIVVGTTALSDKADRPERVENNELVAAIRNLELAVRELADRPVSTAVVAPNVGGAERERAEGELPSSSDIDRLTSALTKLNETLRIRSSGTGTQASLSEIRLSQPSALRLSDAYANEKAARDDLFLMGYDHVLRKLGPPDRIDGSTNTTWLYKDSGSIYFVDGHVAVVNME